MQIEDLGFCAQGRGARVRARDTPSRTTARFPHNTSGGQLSVGQAGAAGGFLGLVEAIRQLTGEAARPAVDGREGRASSSGFGMINFDRGLVLGRGDPGGAHDAAAHPPEAQEPDPAHAAADAAAGRAQPRRARPDGGRGARPVRAAGVPRLRRGAVSAARSLPRLPVGCGSTGSAQDGAGELLADTVLHHSNDLFFRERLPWRLGLVRLDVGPTVVAHLHGDVPPAPARVRVDRAPRQCGPGGARRLPREGDSEHGRRSRSCAS